MNVADVSLIFFILILARTTPKPNPNPRDQTNTSLEMCIRGDPQSLHLTVDAQPATTFYPNVLEGYLHLSLDLVSGSDAAGVNANSSTSDSGAVRRSSGSQSTRTGVVWNASALAVVSQKEEGATEEREMEMEWTIFPSTGLLLPGQR